MDPAKIEALLNEVCQTIGGDWLLVGGSLVQIEYNGGRATEDIDLVQVSHPTLTPVKCQDELFKAAFRLGLDPESVNSAARFFVSEVKGWEGELVEMKVGAKGRILKPTLTLFVALKLRRGTEADLLDVRSAVLKEGVGRFDRTKFDVMVDSSVQIRFDGLRKKFGL
jgi:hypothetical protein